MYVEWFNHEQQETCHALLSFPLWIDAQEIHLPRQGWQHRFADCVDRLLAVQDVDVALRFVWRAGRLERRLWIIAPAEQEKYVDALAGMFLLLNTLAEGSVETARSQQEFDSYADTTPSHCVHVSLPPVLVGRFQFGCRFHLASHLDALHAHFSVQSGQEVLLYQANMRRYTQTPDDLRTVKRHAIHMAEEAIPDSIKEMQSTIAQRFSSCSYLLDEYFGATTSYRQQEQQQIVCRLFEQNGPGRHFPPPIFSGTERREELDNFLLSGWHRDCTAPLPPLERATAALTTEETRQILLWRPTGVWALANTVPIEGTGTQLTRIEAVLRRIERSLTTNTSGRLGASSLNELVQEVRRIGGISRVDHDFVPAKARQILELLISHLLTDKKQARSGNLFNDIASLENWEKIPGNIASYFQTLRVFGNKVVHPEAASGLAARILGLSELGSIRQLGSYPEQNAGESDKGEVTVGSLVIACSNAPEVFELVEASLDDVSFLVDLFVEAEGASALLSFLLSGRSFIASCRDHRFYAALMKQAAHGFSGVALVAG